MTQSLVVVVNLLSVSLLSVLCLRVSDDDEAFSIGLEGSEEYTKQTTLSRNTSLEGVCLSVAGGGFRSLITALAFGEAQGFFERQSTELPYEKMAGTSGGSWGVYALIHLNEIARKGSAWKGFPHVFSVAWRRKTWFGMGGKSWLRKLCTTLSHAHRSAWREGMQKAFARLGIGNRYATSQEQKLVIAASGNPKTRRAPNGFETIEEECAPEVLRYCRMYWYRQDKHLLQTTCDYEGEGDPWSSIDKDDMFNALTTSSSAFTTGRFKQSSPICDLVPKHSSLLKGGRNETIQMHLSDMGSCDTNPWTELLAYPNCTSIINLDTGEPASQVTQKRFKAMQTEMSLEDQSASFMPSVQRARALGWNVTLDEDRQNSSMGELLPMRLERDGRSVRVLNIDIKRLPVPATGSKPTALLHAKSWNGIIGKNIWIDIVDPLHQLLHGSRWSYDQVEHYFYAVEDYFHNFKPIIDELLQTRTAELS